jgi:putative glutathione S-transferase
MEAIMLTNGKWMANLQPVQAKDKKGGFVQQTSTFRNWVTPDGRAGSTGEAASPPRPADIIFMLH